MKKFKRITALIMALVLAVSLCSCSKSGEKMTEWFNEVSTAYDGYLASEDSATAVSPSVSLLVASDLYLKSVLEFIDGKTDFGDDVEITEEDGVYTYKSGYFRQKIEIDKKIPAVKVEMIQEFLGDGTTEFITVITEKDGEYFIQQHLVEFGEYYEIRFTKDGGNTTTKTNCYEMPYSIFEGEIPESFAKEN